MTPVSPLPVDLHSAIMNLPCTMPVADAKAKGATLANVAYRVGHRDARHAAAELASAHGAQLRAEVDRLTKSREELAHWVAKLADSLEAEISNNYPPDARRYTSMQSRYDRDMGEVIAARAALSGPEASA